MKRKFILVKDLADYITTDDSEQMFASIAQTDNIIDLECKCTNCGQFTHVRVPDIYINKAQQIEIDRYIDYLNEAFRYVDTLYAKAANDILDVTQEVYGKDPVYPELLRRLNKYILNVTCTNLPKKKGDNDGKTKHNTEGP